MTVNLGPTFLSGALAANAGAVMDEPSCPLVQVLYSALKDALWCTLLQGPYRHYVLNAIWIFINSLSILLTIYHLHRLYKESHLRLNSNPLLTRMIFELSSQSLQVPCGVA